MTDGDAVSRETPPVPDLARGVFADRLPEATRFAELLATEGVTRGLIGPREAPRLWTRHLLNCALVTDVLPEGATVCDVGSGAGLPGVVLAIRRPDLRVTLLEPLLRRTTFLEEVVDRLRLTNAEVVRDRAEGLHGVRSFDVVTSRAVAPLPRLLAWSLPLVGAGGLLVALKGSSAREEVEAAAADLQRWQVAGTEVLELGTDLTDPPTTLTTVIRVETTDRTRLGWDPNGSRGAPRSARVGDRVRGTGRQRGRRK